MKKSLFISLISVFSMLIGNAQDYKTAIGVRSGFSNGFTVKHFMAERVAIEGILTTRWKGFNLSGLFEIHNRTELKRFNWYFGAGAHIGAWNGKNVNWANDYNDYTVFGIDGIIGIEYNFYKFPFNLSFDWKPSMNLIGYNGFWGDGVGFSVRYTLY